MNLSIIAAFIWLICANLIGFLPSRDKHWTNAYVLIAIGLPILVWVVRDQGLVWGALVLAAACSVLRWPVIYLWRWIRRGFRKGDAL